jgi:branched-chain amino acid transport system ATP-binding protein
MSAAALEVRGLTAGYAGVPAVRNFSLSVEPGEVLALLGANGAGKTTALLSMVGAVTPMTGTVASFGVDITGERVERVARSGIALVPDDRGLFFDLTVAEHLRLVRSDRPDAREAALERFPALRSLIKRRCGLLSGGEQQMLALAKALMTGPKVLMIDEMSLGLAPLVVRDMLPNIRRLATESRAAVILVEQHVDVALQVADQAIVMNRGEIALTGEAKDLAAGREAVEAAYFGQGPGGDAVEPQGQAGTAEEISDYRKGQHEMTVTPTEFMAQLDSHLKAEPARTSGLTAVIEFDISGDTGGKWWVDAKDGSGAVSREAPGDSDLTISMTDEVLVAMATGELDGTQAYFDGKMKVDGDQSKLMYMAPLFGQ